MPKRSVAAVLVAKVIAYLKALYVRKMGKAVKRIEVIVMVPRQAQCYALSILSRTALNGRCLLSQRYGDSCKEEA